MLNIVFKMLIHNNDDSNFIKEFCLPQHIRMEEICLRAVKFSLEIQTVPIRKFLILFQIYLRFLFGKDPVPGDIVSTGCGRFENFKYLKEYTIKLMSDCEEPRYP